MTIQYDFDQIIDRRASESAKWNTYGKDVLPLWVADMDFISPQPVINVLQARVRHGVYGYPENVMETPKDLLVLRQTILERMSELYKWSISPEDILFLPGVVTGFNLACHAMVNPDQAVLVQIPVYPPILRAAKETGILHQEMELTRCLDGT